MKRLLMISYPFPPNASAGAVRSQRFAHGLRDHGWEVEVVTIKPNDACPQDPPDDAPAEAALTVHHTATLDPWLWLSGKKPRVLPARAARSLGMKLFSFPDHMTLWIPFALNAGMRAHRRRSFDAIYTTSPPHSTHLAGAALAAMTSRPWIADFRDPWTQNTYRSSVFSGKFQRFLDKRMEETVLRRAAVVLANTRLNRANLLRGFREIPEDKIVHLPNGWEDSPATEGLPVTANGPFTVIHSGTFYPWFEPYGLLRGAAVWRRRQAGSDASRLRIILLGSHETATERAVDELELRDIVDIRPWVPLEEARRIMQDADVLWATLGTGAAAAGYVPSKLLEYVGARKPIWGFFPDGEAADIIRSTSAGTVFTSENPDDVAAHIAAAIERKARFDWPRISEAGPALDAYRLNSVVDRFAGLLDSACGFVPQG